MLTKRFRRFVSFANFAKTHRLEPGQLAGLLQLAGKAFSASEREANTGKPADKQRDAFEAYAQTLGFGVEWNGLGPTLIRDDRSIYLPDIG